jgi:NADH-ubiquinone oxidoreductase chain 2
VGSVVGLTQFRIKRLYAYSTISHVGFILLALSIHSVESIQAFIFYIMQYSISNLNAFILIISIGYSLYYYIDNDQSNTNSYNNKNNNYKSGNNLKDKNNSPIQLISQLKGYYYINPVLALSLSITLFSFVGVPPLIGFFAKQMILSAALDNGYIFMSLVAILASVISAVYYLSVIKQIFFDKPDYKLNPILNNLNLSALITDENIIIKKIKFTVNNIALSSYLSLTVSILTIIILMFLFIPQE